VATPPHSRRHLQSWWSSSPPPPSPSPPPPGYIATATSIAEAACTIPENVIQLLGASATASFRFPPLTIKFDPCESLEIEVDSGDPRSLFQLPIPFDIEGKIIVTFDNLLPFLLTSIGGEISASFSLATLCKIVPVLGVVAGNVIRALGIDLDFLKLTLGAAYMPETFSTCNIDGTQSGRAGSFSHLGNALALYGAVGSELEMCVYMVGCTAFKASLLFDTRLSPMPGTAIDTCIDNCGSYSRDGDCDDGGPGAEYNSCAEGNDCTDCGRRGDQTTFFGGVTFELEIQIPIYNWGRPKSTSYRLLPRQKPKPNSFSCKNKQHYFKDHRNADPKLYHELFKIDH